MVLTRSCGRTRRTWSARTDIVSIDVEGWEFEVVRGFSVERCGPRVLIAENVFADVSYRHAPGACGYRLWRHVVPNDVYVPATLR